MIKNRSLIGDEPAEELLFGFDSFVKQIVRVLEDRNTVTPFVVAINGEWGSGKTSLIRAVKKKIDEIKLEDYDVVEFDAWEYERVDLVASLLDEIQSVYGHCGRTLGTAVGSFIMDATLRKTVSMSKKDAEKHFRKFIKQTRLIKNDLEKIIGNRKLVVLVDDLDRCNIENVLNMLEAIKMFLTAKGVIFVVAADMEKIEKAWKLRYRIKEGLEEGREYADKIFQLRLSLPPKHPAQIERFVHEIVPDSLTSFERRFLIHGCPANPRTIKRVLNLEYFVLVGILDSEEYKDDYENSVDGIEKSVQQVIDPEELAPLVMVWCILVTAFAYLARVTKNNPESLLRMSVICSTLTSFEKLDEVWSKWLKTDDHTPLAEDLSPIASGFIDGDTRRGLSQIIEKKDYAAFELLREIATRYKLSYKIELPASIQPQQDAHRIYSILDKIIKYAGMTGI